VRRTALAALACLGAALPGAGAARAQEDTPEGRVHLAVEAERHVANDRAVATLELIDEGEDPAELADRVSRRVSAALARAEREPGVDVRTGGIQTQPVFHEGQLRRWRATQRLVLETARLETLPSLLGELQSEVPLASVEFTVSPEARRAVEEDLIAEALTAFRARAAGVGETLGARDVRIHQLHIDTGSSGPMPLGRSRGMAMEAAAAPPLAAGTSRVTVTVRGSVQLDLP
jgi:predicted secreted protein